MLLKLTVMLQIKVVTIKEAAIEAAAEIAHCSMIGFSVEGHDIGWERPSVVR